MMPTKSRSIILHILGILAFLSIPVFTSPDFNSNRDMLMVSEFRKDFLRYFLLLLFFYANFYYFIPRFYFPKKTFLYFALIFISYALIVGITDFLFPSGMHHNMMPPPDMGNHPMPPNEMFFVPQGGSLFQFLLVLALSFILKINSQLTEINSEKLNAEVSYLKAQINPHFLFNTLNSLYALTLQKSNEAPNAVLKLSSIMRYVVTESSQEFVTLDKELNYIKDYIELQKLRLDNSASLSFEVKGTSMGRAIAPLILIPFIENAFKYGINPDENSFIGITIEIEEQILKMNVKNSIVAAEIDEEFKTEEGLKNTQKRLDLIYSGKYDLDVTEDKKTYEVNLKIDLL